MSVRAAGWMPIASLSQRFSANVAAFANRDAALATRLRLHRPHREHFIAATADGVTLGEKRDDAIHPLPVLLPPLAARSIVDRLINQSDTAFPAIVAGLDQGWLWDGLSKLSLATPAPGHRPPLFLLCNDLERFWVLLHVHDWRALLADSKNLIFCGPSAVGELKRHLVYNPQVPLPRTAVTIDASLWSSGITIDTLNAEVIASTQTAIDQSLADIHRTYAGRSPEAFSAILRQPGLRVLGITSRYTSFLQHSMRDWLAGIEALGHETRLLIEQLDHEVMHPALYLREIADFQPDVVVMIDHYRQHMPHVPAAMPWVMWVQDRLPTIFRAEAGPAQGALDFCIGYGRRECVHDFGYPAAQFVESPVGVNESRFVDGRLRADRCDYDCDISYVSHASKPAEALVAERIDAAGGTDEAKRLFHGLYERLKALYDRGESVVATPQIVAMVNQVLVDLKLSVSTPQVLVDFVTHQLNNAMFRHQTVAWAIESGRTVHLWGNGWEAHPRFARHSRGPADNATQLREIYCRSKLNLQVSPFGAAHQRVFEGVCSGGFFLLRETAGDGCEVIQRELAEFCAADRIFDDAALRAALNDSPAARSLMDRLSALTHYDPMSHAGFVDMLHAGRAAGYVRAASTIWPEFPEIAFNNRDQFNERILRFVDDISLRNSVVYSMRARVLRTMTYRAISRRMFANMADQLAPPHRDCRTQEAA